MSVLLTITVMWMENPVAMSGAVCARTGKRSCVPLKLSGCQLDSGLVSTPALAAISVLRGSRRTASA
jgi:hypothetical protein